MLDELRFPEWEELPENLPKRGLVNDLMNPASDIFKNYAEDGKVGGRTKYPLFGKRAA